MQNRECRARLPVVLDTDIGSDVDDLLAISIAATCERLNLLAVTTVSGDVAHRAKIARRVLDLLNCRNVPVYAGQSLPIGTGPGFVWFGTEGEGILSSQTEVSADSTDGVGMLAAILRDTPGLEIIAIGPLTNLGIVIQRHPELVQNIGRITIMGGYLASQLYIGGTALPYIADYNLCADPTATFQVFRSGAPIQLICLDATIQSYLTRGDIFEMCTKGSDFHLALLNATELWTPILHAIFIGFGIELSSEFAAFLHDPLALICAIDEDFCRFEDLEIEPAIVNGVFRTLVRDERTQNTISVRCATGVSTKSFRGFLTSRLQHLY